MIDHIKLICREQQIINRLHQLPELRPYRHSLNTYEGYELRGSKLRLDFRKCFESGRLVGYGHLELSISPHYHHNRYLHNGNDLTPQNAVKSLKEIFALLGISEPEYDQFRVVNLEFGLNLIPQTDIRKIVSGISFYKKTPFRISDFEFNKITDATKYKLVKAYAKGLQFAEFPHYGIDPNTFRFEVRNKKSAPIRKLGISTAKDLVKLSIYKTLGQRLINEWLQVLILDNDPEFKQCTQEVKQQLEKYGNLLFWQQTIQDRNRNKYSRERKICVNMFQKYGIKPTAHQEILTLISDKIFSFGIGADCPQKKTAEKPAQSPAIRGRNADKSIDAVVQVSPHARVVKGQSAPQGIIQRQCLVTGLDISMQKTESRFLYNVGLRYYRENDPKKYDAVLQKYWSADCRGKDEDGVHRTIAHNIRNTYNNNRYRLQREVLPGQLELFGRT